MSTSSTNKEFKQPELKACPFCGGQAKLAHRSARYRSDEVHTFVKCTVCGCRTAILQLDKARKITFEDVQRIVVDKWNRRES